MKDKTQETKNKIQRGFIQPHGAGAGFTMIEIMLYVSIAATILLIVTSFFGTLLEVRIKNQTIEEIEQQGSYAMYLMEDAIRNTDGITSPTQGLSDSSLTLSGSQIIVFDLSDGTLRITEGAGSPIALTNNRIRVDAIQFHNVSRGSTPGVIRITLWLSYINASGKQEYEFSRVFYGSASLR